MELHDATFMALLDRYLAGESTAIEAEQVRQWLAADSENYASLNEIDRIRGVARNRPPATRVDIAWSRAVSELGIDAGMRGAHVSAPTMQPRSHRRTHSDTSVRTWTWRAIAASLAVAAAASIIITTSRTSPSSQQKLEAREFVTARGQRVNIQLADGSELTIGPASHVKVAGDFGVKAREVTLVGEAAFVVKHDASKPFRVHTANGTVEDLGTEFVIDAYPQSATKVVVASGKVSLSGTALTHGQLGQRDRSGLVTVASNVDLNSWFGWTKGRLSFRDTPAADAFARLSLWYDMDFVLIDKRLKTLPLTASFHDESSAQVLKVLDLTLRLRHEVRGRTVTFYPADGR